MADIQLSHQLLNEMQELVTRHHEGADPGVVMQYMAAIMGYMLASQSQFEMEQQKQYLENLCEFMPMSPRSSSRQRRNPRRPRNPPTAFGSRTSDRTGRRLR